jgi:nucleoside-diphosphate-sugar epimerase
VRAFVTGGSGFVGRNLVRHLRSRGDEVRALARSTAAIETVTRLGATAVEGDLDALDALRQGMAGCDAVFHAAALAAEWGPREAFHHFNVEGTRNALDVLENLARARAGRLVPLLELFELILQCGNLGLKGLNMAHGHSFMAKRLKIAYQ